LRRFPCGSSSSTVDIVDPVDCDATERSSDSSGYPHTPDDATDAADSVGTDPASLVKTAAGDPGERDEDDGCSETDWSGRLDGDTVVVDTPGTAAYATTRGAGVDDKEGGSGTGTVVTDDEGVCGVGAGTDP
jgi:hypothetical protein